MGPIQRHHVSEAKVVVPCGATLKAANDEQSSLLERIIVMRIESRTLATVRDTLRPELVSGELCVKDAELFV